MSDDGIKALAGTFVEESDDGSVVLVAFCPVVQEPVQNDGWNSTLLTASMCVAGKGVGRVHAVVQIIFGGLLYEVQHRLSSASSDGLAVLRFDGPNWCRSVWHEREQQSRTWRLCIGSSLRCAGRHREGGRQRGWRSGPSWPAGCGRATTLRCVGIPRRARRDRLAPSHSANGAVSFLSKRFLAHFVIPASPRPAAASSCPPSGRGRMFHR